MLRAAHDRLKASFGRRRRSARARRRDPALDDGARSSTAVAEDRLRRAERGAAARRPRSSPCTRSSRGSSSGGASRSTRAASTGARRRRSRSPRCSSTGSRSGSPARTRSAGTFSQRHLVLHDVHTGETFTPMQHLDDASASFEVFNSPLSEYACVGFEYGYSAAAPEALVLWEAQYGDFANGAQIVIDQFISSALSKWRETSRLTLLLPHGYEGNGPEHSSARLERFLQLAAQENIRIANCTTAAQYFHLLRRQALDPTARPLVVMTPKGLLRLKEASSTLADLADGALPAGDRRRDAPTRQRVRAARALLRQGLLRPRRPRGARRRGEVAVARIEQLYPFPTEAAARARRVVPALDEVVWAQEEPQNMGPWRSIRHRLEEAAGRRAAALRRPPVAREPVRGLPDGARDRAGPHRARRADGLGALG